MRENAPPKGAFFLLRIVCTPLLSYAVRMKGYLYILIPVLLSGMAVAAEENEGKKVYRSVGEGGVVEFTDVPDKAAEEVKVPPTQTYKAKPIKPTISIDEAEESPVFRYQKLQIASPQNEETIFDNSGNVTINVAVSPAIPKALRHKLEVYVDGKLQAGAGTSLQLTNLDRGSHTVSARVVDGTGAVLIKSAETVFFVRRHSKLFKKPATPAR